MVLISKDQLDRIQREKNDDSKARITAAEQTDTSVTIPTLQSTQTVGDNLTRLDNDMKHILDSRLYEDEPTKLKEYLRVLQRYLFFTDEKRQPAYPKTEITESNSLSVDSIIESLPKLYQKKGQLLIKHLKNNPNRIRWNEKGTVFIDNGKINGSNIIDLINDASRNRKNIKAIGRREFSTLLREIDTPREFIGNPDLLNITASRDKDKKIVKSDDDDENFLSLKDSKIDFSERTSKSISSLIDDTVLEKHSTPKRFKGKTPRKTSTPKTKNKNSLFWIDLKGKENVVKEY